MNDLPSVLSSFSGASLSSLWVGVVVGFMVVVVLKRVVVDRCVVVVVVVVVVAIVVAALVPFIALLLSIQHFMAEGHGTSSKTSKQIIVANVCTQTPGQSFVSAVLVMESNKPNDYGNVKE